MPEYFRIVLLLLSQLPIFLYVSLGNIRPSLFDVLIMVVYEIGVFLVAFWRKVWTKIEGRLVDSTASWAEALVSHRKFRHRYLEHIISDYAPFNVRGLDNINPLKFEHVFVDVRIKGSTPQIGNTRLIKHKRDEDLEGNRSIWDFIDSAQSREHNAFAFVIVAPPGSGKTTLLQNIALTMAGGENKRHHARAYLPIMLFLREHSDAIVKEQPPLHEVLEAYFMDQKKYPMLEPPIGFFKDQLKEGKCLVLLDGLDEVADPRDRKAVSEWVDRQIKNYSRCRFIVTSRPQGYKIAPLQTATVLEVLPFNVSQVQKFIENWYQAHELMKAREPETDARNKAANQASNLITRLRAMPALNEMTVNPLLLTMIVIVHHYHGALPGSREKLYAELCDVLLERRDAARQIRVKFTASQSLAALRPLAAFMMKCKLRDITLDKMLSVIAQPLQDAGIVKEDIQNFPRELELSSGLLLETEHKSWSFAHLSFQEYLAAAHWLRQKDFQEDWRTLVNDSWWYETLRFYSAQTNADPIAEACLEVNTEQAWMLLADFSGKSGLNAKPLSPEGE